MTSTNPETTLDSDGRRPSRALRAAALLVLLEAVALDVVTVLYLVELVRGEAEDATVAVAVAVMAFAAAAGLLLVARGLARRRRWSRAPAVVVNLLVLPISWTFLNGDWPYVGVLLGVWALAVLWLLFTPAVQADLGDELPA